MASEILVKQGTAIVWADATNYTPVAGGFSQTEALTLGGLTAGAAKQGAQADLQHLATDKFPARWLVAVSIAFNTAPTAGETVDFYWSGSPSSTAANANPGGASGSDGAYTGIVTLADSLLQLQYIGSLIAEATTSAQYQTIGVLSTILRYGAPIVVNSSAADPLKTTATSAYVALVPLVDEAQ